MVKQKKKPVQVYLTEEQRKKLERLSSREGLGFSGFFIDLLRKAK